MERQRYKVVLLDEFQDTSYAQLVLFSRLFGEGHAVTAVGDPNQSIYGFRVLRQASSSTLSVNSLSAWTGTTGRTLHPGPYVVPHDGVAQWPAILSAANIMSEALGRAEALKTPAGSAAVGAATESITETGTAAAGAMPAGTATAAANVPPCSPVPSRWRDG
ncbi:exodeoxyribonuclease V beta chain [Arthrobacter sp. Hiyo4]|nr:exodeoxyribonuclease V beta chain [Arthrobacter sp. Hiyo4]